MCILYESVTPDCIHASMAGSKKEKPPAFAGGIALPKTYSSLRYSLFGNSVILAGVHGVLVIETFQHAIVLFFRLQCYARMKSPPARTGQAT